MGRRIPQEYHLIDTLKGVSHGGFVSLEAAREEARLLGLHSWQIYRGDNRVEHHDPDHPDPPAPCMIVLALQILKNRERT
jgi:hypothetical protein